jgi:phosphoglycerol transferase MdoB-like AlkP superfamily enzyme
VLNCLPLAPFLLQLMTTSNHCPRTYPDNRIDIKSGNGCDGAVKYTDYAIGEFLDQARKKPWFDNTIFIFVADHTVGSACCRRASSLAIISIWACSTAKTWRF